MTVAQTIWRTSALMPLPRARFARRRRRQVSLMSGITAAEAWVAAKAAETNLDPRDYQQNAAFSDAVMDPVIQAGDMSYWLSLSSAPPATISKVVLAGGAATLGLTISSAAAKLAGAAVLSSALGLATVGVGALISVFELIRMHHAAAVKREQATYYQALPAAANTFQIILQGVRSGQITPQQGIAALQSLNDDFFKAINCGQSGCYGHSPYCNALCEAKIRLDAYVRYWQSQFQDMASGSAAASTPTGAAAGSPSAAGQIAAPFGIPAWLLWVLGGVLVYQLL